jgi:16S rRNA (guanine1207-N2)-methyltransferase
MSTPSTAREIPQAAALPPIRRGYPRTAMTDHYFSPDPGLEHRPRELHVRLAGRDVDVVTAGGVFSSGRVDLGTTVLLREVPAPPEDGDLLDLGCGWGPLALTMALESPLATVWAVDVNSRARELTAVNAGRLGVRNLRVAAPDEVPAEVRFAQIWSNPPIRIGKDQLHELLLRWLPRLSPDGSAYLVVQRNLGADSLHRWLAEQLPPDQGWQVQRVGSAKGFRVLRVSR